ncbi:hypothetical protein GCM10027277_54550 [Pseudoduganella ginsengisoli]
MSLHKKKIHISVLLAGLLISSIEAQAQLPRKAEFELKKVKAEKSDRVKHILEKMRSSRKEFNLQEESDFEEINSESDEFGETHVRLQQKYKNLKVWGATVVAHLSAEKHLRQHSGKILPSPHIDTNARLLPENAILIAEHDLGKKVEYDTKPIAELIIYPVSEHRVAERFKNEKHLNADMMEEIPLRNLLAYHVHLNAENNPAGGVSMDYIIDANTGDVISKWSRLFNAHAIATSSRSQYNGVVSINTNSYSALGTSGYELRDMQRGNTLRYGESVAGNTVWYARPEGTGETSVDIATDTTNTWGDGFNYTAGAGNDTRQTAAVDTAYAIAATWDFLKKIVNREGLDNKGTAVRAIILDQGTGANATWFPSSLTGRFGAGDSSNNYKNMNSLDIVAHEMGHGVTAAGSALGLTGKVESRQLNEAVSDVLGTMVEFYVRGGAWAAGSTTIPNAASGANWTLGDQVNVPRLMNNTTTWTGTDSSAAPHIGGLPFSRAFYLLAQGGNGVTALGNDTAFRIFYRAWNYYFNASTDYVGARQAMITAARDLYGSGSIQEQSVWNAFGVIRVGPMWTSNACGTLDSGRQLNYSGIKSCNGLYTLQVNADGYMALYNGQNAIWYTNTGGNTLAYAAMQSDGNFVLYKSLQQTGPQAALWNTETWDYPQSYLRIADDGNLIVYTSTGLPLWSRVALPSNLLPVVGNGGNTSVNSAQLIPPTAPGVTSALNKNESHYYRIDIPAGKTLKADFVGRALTSTYGGGVTPYWNDKWEISISSVLGGDTMTATDAYNPRKTVSYTNTSAATISAFVKVYQYIFTFSSEDVSIPHKYSVAFKIE